MYPYTVYLGLNIVLYTVIDCLTSAGPLSSGNDTSDVGLRPFNKISFISDSSPEPQAQDELFLSLDVRPPSVTSSIRPSVHRFGRLFL